MEHAIDKTSAKFQISFQKGVGIKKGFNGVTTNFQPNRQ